MDRTVAGSLRGLLAVVALGATAACGGTVQGPRAGDVIPLAFMVAPSGPALPSAIFGADIDSVHVQVSRYDESTAADVMIPWPASSNGLRVSVDVEMTQRVETLYVYVDLRAGQSTLFYASNQVVVEPGRVVRHEEPDHPRCQDGEQQEQQEATEAGHGREACGARPRTGKQACTNCELARAHRASSRTHIVRARAAGSR